MPSRALIGLCLIAACSISACMPRAVTLHFAGDPSRLEATEVMREHLPDERGGGGTIALIDVRGLITDAPRPTLLGEGESPADELVARLRRAADDTSVRAIVLRINSPGGTVTGSEVMFNEVRHFREMTGKPVVASLGEVAASGGYLLALAADEIIAQPTSITGSIGVIIPTVNVSEGLSRIGIVSRSVTSGPNKDMGNPLEPFEERHYVLLQALVDEYYARFRSRVQERRTPAGLDPARLDELADGRILTGTAAVSSRLADREGGVRDAVHAAMRLAGLSHARVVKYHAQGDGARSAYAESPTRVEVSLLRIDGVTGALAGAPPGLPYYLWLPDGQ